jgi:hypothetical protein
MYTVTLVFIAVTLVLIAITTAVAACAVSVPAEWRAVVYVTTLGVVAVVLSIVALCISVWYRHTNDMDALAADMNAVYAHFAANCQCYNLPLPKTSSIDALLNANTEFYEATALLGALASTIGMACLCVLLGVGTAYDVSTPSAVTLLLALCAVGMVPILAYSEAYNVLHDEVNSSLDAIPMAARSMISCSAYTLAAPAAPAAECPADGVDASAECYYTSALLIRDALPLGHDGVYRATINVSQPLSMDPGICALVCDLGNGTGSTLTDLTCKVQQSYDNLEKKLSTLTLPQSAQLCAYTVLVGGIILIHIAYILLSPGHHSWREVFRSKVFGD